VIQAGLACTGIALILVHRHLRNCAFGERLP
jgi:hypothetical protein